MPESVTYTVNRFDGGLNWWVVFTDLSLEACRAYVRKQRALGLTCRYAIERVTKKVIEDSDAPTSAVKFREFL